MRVSYYWDFKTVYAKINTTQNIFIAVAQTDSVETDYYFRDAQTVTIKCTVTNKIRHTKAFWVEVAALSEQLLYTVFVHTSSVFLCGSSSTWRVDAVHTQHGGSFLTHQICGGHADRGHLFPIW